MELEIEQTHIYVVCEWAYVLVYYVKFLKCIRYMCFT